MKLEIKNLKINILTTGEEIISEASFDLSEKEMILITGNNGSGKSSLLSAIFKHPQYEIVSGDIVLINENNEVNITKLKTFEIAKSGLYLSMQHVPEIEGVNLLQFLYRSYKNISEKNDLSILDFNKELISFCKKYEISEEFLKRDLNVGMSGGEKKQAEMLHLFAMKPKFVFMDEPDSGVDKGAIKKVFEIIKDLQKDFNTAFCIVSHSQNLEEYLKVDRIYEMQNKKLKLC